MLCVLPVSNRYLFLILIITAVIIYYVLISNTCLIKDMHMVLKKHNSQRLLFANIRLSSIYMKIINFINPMELKEDFAKYNIQFTKPRRKLPDALIIGVKKCGTRALIEFIRLHPDVRAAGSEIHFFDKYYHKGFEWYRHKMPLTLKGQLTMEKTPSYWITKSTPKRVHSMNPNIKLIVVVRDPVTRAISDYTQAFSKHPTMSKFEDLLFVNGTLTYMYRYNATNAIDSSWQPIKLGVYVRPYRKWLKRFPKDQIYFVNGERLITDPSSEMAKIQKFLNLKRVINEKHFYFNVSKGFPCLLKSEESPTPKCLGKTKGRNHPNINKNVLKRLREFYKPFNYKFYKLSGINFGWP